MGVFSGSKKEVEKLERENIELRNNLNLILKKYKSLEDIEKKISEAEISMAGMIEDEISQIAEECGEEYAMKVMQNIDLAPFAEQVENNIAKGLRDALQYDHVRDFVSKELKNVGNIPSVNENFENVNHQNTLSSSDNYSTSYLNEENMTDEQLEHLAIERAIQARNRIS